MSLNEIEQLKNQLTIARNEINKLRHQVKNLSHIHHKDFEGLNEILKNFRCEGCRSNEENLKNSNNSSSVVLDIETGKDLTSVDFRPIGIIKSAFPEKRAVPRQSSVGAKLKGTIILNNEIFTNPEHSLEGLEEFSHLWVIYHFHRNGSHPKAKVSPPRLGGERVGVFSSRSPHRPCPIGLSLVEIDKIDGSTIHFNGTDMVDGTPVLDIKPYIPFYDAPNFVESGRLSAGDTIDFYTSRQEPDGEENETEGAIGGINPPIFTNSVPLTAVKVPSWIVATDPLKVVFNERAEAQLEDLKIDEESITSVLKTDPRSVYLKTKHGSQIFTFQLSEVTVTCKFDDKNSTVTVVQIRKKTNVQDDEDDLISVGSNSSGLVASDRLK